MFLRYNLTNSTFAWFTANTQLTVNSSADPITASVDTTTKQDGLTVLFDIAVTPVRSSKGAYQPDDQEANYNPMSGNMELVTRFSSATASTKGHGAVTGTNFGYIDGGGVTRYQTSQITNPTIDYWRVYKVDVAIHHEQDQSYQTIGNQNYTDSEIWGLLANEYFTITVSQRDANSIAFFYAANSETNAIADGSGTALKISAAENVKFSAANLTTPSFYFGMYIDGESHNEALTGGSLQDGDFTVTLAKV